MFTFGFALAKHPRVPNFRFALRRQLALAMTANPAAAVVVEIVEFCHLREWRTVRSARRLVNKDLFGPPNVPRSSRSKQSDRKFDRRTVSVDLDLNGITDLFLIEESIKIVEFIHRFSVH